jgi:hypothetical protein
MKILYPIITEPWLSEVDHCIETVVSDIFVIGAGKANGGPAHKVENAVDQSLEPKILIAITLNE